MFGLDISDASVEALELKRSFGKIKLVGYTRVELPEGIVRDGVVLKKKALSEALKKLLSSAKPKAIASREAVLSLPESKVFTHIFKFPAKLKSKQIADILSFEVPNVLPISPEDVYSDFLILGKTDSEQEIFYVAVPQKVVDDLREVAKSAGFIPRVFDMESVSFARALGPELGDNSLIVDIGARTTIISIFDKRGIKFTTNVPVAGDALTDTIVQKLKIKKEEAEKLKKECGLLLKGGRCRAGQVFLIVQSALQPILREIWRIIKFYEEKSGQKIKKVVLCGGSSMLPNIVNYFKENLGLEVLVGKPHVLERIRFSWVEITPLLLNVFGLALRGVEKNPEKAGVNLTCQTIGSAGKRKNRGKKFFRYLLAVGFLAIFIFFVFAFYKFWPTVPSKLSHPQNIPLSFEARISTGDRPAEIEGRILEIRQSGSKNFPATGKKTIAGRAGGKVKIVNNSQTRQTLIATTRLLSEENILFRLKDDVTIPAGGETEAEVYTDEVGAVGDVEPGKFTIPGLSAFMQKVIYAESEASMTGGAVLVTVVSQEDIERAKGELLEELKMAAMEEAGKSSAGERENLFPSVLDFEVTQITADPGQDQAAENFELRITMNFKFLAIPTDALEKIMRDKLMKRGVQNAGVYEFINLDYSLVIFDRTTGEAVIKIDVLAVNM